MINLIKNLKYWLYKKKYLLLRKLAKEQIEDALSDLEIELWRNHQEELEKEYERGYKDGLEKR